MYKVLSIKYLKKIFFLFILATCYLLALSRVEGLLATAAPTAQAQTMSNKDYTIKTEDVDMTSDITTKRDYETGSAVDNLGPVASGEVNYKVKTGFENLASAHPFSVSLSSSIVDFGALSPTNPIIRTVNLNIHSLTTYGYSVLVFENEPLTTTPPENRIIIPDVTCDNGDCDAQNATEWTNSLTYGFGYRCDNVTGTDCNSSFSKANFYKHFPNIAGNDDPQSIMSGIGSDNKEVRISHKVNISGNQAQGFYNNVITYIGVPNF